MLWHNGDVYDAVSKVKESQSYLFVFVRDENTTQEYVNILENSVELHDILGNSICLNLLKDTNEYNQFSEVYKVTDIPSIFIITHQGEIIEIIKEVVDEESLCVQLRKVFGLEPKEFKNADLPLEFNSSTNTTDNSTTRNEVVNMEEKMAEIKRILAEKHKQKSEEERNKQKEDELKRRDLGKQLHQLKQTQKEREENEIKAELKRKRDEEKHFRDTILRQIEDDKLERKQKFLNQAASLKSTDEPTETQVTNRNIATDSTVRFLFRFPDGSSVNHKFDINDKFFVVREFVAQHIRSNIGYYDIFEIRQFFPRQIIETTNDTSSLLDLNLYPSASFAVLFISKPSNPRQVTNYLNFILAPINFLLCTLLSLVQGVRNWLFPVSRGTELTNKDADPKHVQTSSNWEERQKRLLAAQGRTIKKDGNLVGFSDADKKNENIDDDDEARWNGNSTQQM